MADHKHGNMDTTVQEETFDGFVSFVTKSVIAIICVLLFMALVGG
ncbi:aa3 type cytochrome c oxidase subunit IV [Thalassovita taeanensis]|uniref:Aa3 type cytochrome c oxidase subunit IV n=1 Tax=Thalassovita taeanensis TaxID=657014 RepID=A0A1H9AU85_9RHOB|nr:aa3-type cytochrome c oxidase subunit IV [Thalassovita taeanensis]SEP79498.1 aa3 type cytochrome c oxidase subunit IV [Thalassovita taeanensis]